MLGVSVTRLGLPLAIMLVCLINVILGWRWSKLTQNPWAGMSLGGAFRTPAPGLFPARLSVSEINRRGRILMATSPVISIAVIILYLIAR
jgi:hypothetical protein